jgi:hypothetical protein
MSCIALTGCQTTVTVTPQVAAKNPSTCQIHAAVRYDGKPDYLPAALVPDPGVAGPASFRYSFEAQYGLKEIPPLLSFVNPLVLVGFPTGSDNVVVTGRVDMIRGDATVRSYGAAAAMKRSGTVFSEGETFTEMRRRGLLLVRDNLSGQLCNDQAELTFLLNDRPSTTDGHQ